MDKHLRNSRGMSMHKENNPKEPASDQNLQASSSILGNNNLQLASSPAMGLRRSPRLQRKYLNQEIAQPLISSTPKTQANKYSKAKGSSNSDTSSMKQSGSPEVAMVTEENPRDTTMRNVNVMSHDNNGDNAGYDAHQTNSHNDTTNMKQSSSPEVAMIAEETTRSFTVTSQDNNSDNSGHDTPKTSESGYNTKRQYRISPDMHSTNYRGICRHSSGHYQANIWNNTNPYEKPKSIYLGIYDNEEEAANAYDLAALKLFGPSTTINFPLVDYRKELEEMKDFSKSEYIRTIKRRSKGFSKNFNFRGVTRSADGKKWQARLAKSKGEKSVYLGAFATGQEAAKAYDIAAIRLKGPGAAINFELSGYDVEGIRKSGKIPIGEGASKRIKQSPAEEIALWRSRSGIYGCGPYLSQEKLVIAAGSYQPWETAALEKFQTQADQGNGNDGAEISWDPNDDYDPNDSFSFHKEIEVPHSQINLSSNLHESAGPHGDSLSGESAVRSLEFSSFRLQNPMQLLPAPSRTIANPDCQGSGFPISGPIEDCEGISSWSDLINLMNAPTGTNRTHVGEYMQEPLPDGNIPDVDWDKILSGEDVSEKTSNRTDEMSMDTCENKASDKHGTAVPDPGSLDKNAKSTVAVSGGNSTMAADGETGNPGCVQGDGWTDNSFDGIGSLFPGIVDDVFEFGVPAGWLNEFSKNNRDGNDGSN